MHWDSKAKAVIEGGEMAYAIKDNTLLGSEFKYNLFTAKKPEETAVRHRALLAFDETLSLIGKSAMGTTKRA